MTPTQVAIEVVGWVGAALILAAYILVSTNRLSGQSRLFQWMNVVGAAGFIVNSGYKQAWPSTALNVVWVAIGIYTLARIAGRSV